MKIKAVYRVLACLLFASGVFLHAQAPSLLANGTLYVSGQGSGAKDFSAQVSDTMAKLQIVLRGAGMDFGNVVWLNIYLTDAKNLTAMEDIYWQKIGSSPPARTVLTVAALPN
jgi:enamine deaminase RidA (YjgF/YER057c/UK114 family)